MYRVLQAHREFDAFERMLEAARSGDEAAFARMWRWLNPSVLRWLRVVAPGSAEDVCSEVWLTIARKLDSFAGSEDEFRAWVFMTARRRAIDAARRRSRQPATVRLDGFEPAGPTDASTSVIEHEQVEEALGMLRELPAQQAEVLALRLIGGLTVAEAAAVVEATEGTVRVWCHRGLRTLAVRMNSAEILEGVTR